jgi:NodT family efflux transporter outer membrane factor (OMF) lipoprotein
MFKMKIFKKYRTTFGKLQTFQKLPPLSIMKQFALFLAFLAIVGLASCKLPAISQMPELKSAPSTYNNSTDTTNSADKNWREFFNDKNLIALIDTAITNNPDVFMALQDIEMAKNKVLMRHGALFPSVTVGGGLGFEKVGRYTSQGAGDASAEITPGKIVPEILTDFSGGIRASWEIDIWDKLKMAKTAAFTKYLGTIEGRNLVITNLVAEVANSYYELLALDNQLDILRETIKLQQTQLEVVKVQKEAAVVTELAVKQFEAQILNSQSMEFEILQSIVEVENKINFLLGRYPQPIVRDKETLTGQLPNRVTEGIPSQLLRNRPDIRQAELEIIAAKWDVKVAQLEFYPSLSISGALGLQAFRPDYLIRLPESLLTSFMTDMAGPIINKNAIMAEFKTANALQIQAMYEYQKRVLNAYLEVTTELSRIDNLEKQYTFKAKEVDVQIKSIDIANDLFRYARANYLEVLNTQREALSSKLELIELKQRQFNAVTNVYRALGGGWK